MEFEISSDQRTGKPIACRVVRLEAGSVSFEVCHWYQLIIIYSTFPLVKAWMKIFHSQKFRSSKILEMNLILCCMLKKMSLCSIFPIWCKIRSKKYFTCLHFWLYNWQIKRVIFEIKSLWLTTFSRKLLISPLLVRMFGIYFC